MIARLTRILLIVQFLAAVALFYAVRGHVPAAWQAGAIALGLVLLFRFLITANNFLLARLYRAPTPPEFQLTLVQSLRLLGGEFVATMVSSSWSMPFFAFDQRLVKHSHYLPVLLVHGYVCNSGYWNSMSRALHASGISHTAMNLEPIGASIGEYAVKIHEAVERLCAATGRDKIIILAHSMGGLATRTYLREHGTARTAGVITLGTPHHGTGLANFGAGINSREMRWTGRGGKGEANQWLQQLAGREDQPLRSRFVSIYSHHDNIISPPTSSHLPDAKNIEFAGIGHVALARDPHIQARVVQEIILISGAPAAAAPGRR